MTSEKRLTIVTVTVDSYRGTYGVERSHFTEVKPYVDWNSLEKKLRDKMSVMIAGRIEILWQEFDVNLNEEFKPVQD